jgi:transglutaminase-like putative cysteine protease
VGRAILVALPPAVAVAYAWTRLEVSAEAWRTGGVLALALAPIALRGSRRRMTGAGVSFVLASSLAFSAWPGGQGHWPGDLFGEAGQGLRDFYVVALPFAADARLAMHGLVLLAVLGFVLAIALAAAAGRPLACSAAAAAGVSWPATIVPGHDTIAIGAVALGAALWPPVALRARGARGLAPALVALAAVVVVASAAADAGLRPSESAVAWQRWTLFGEPASAAGVRLVWDASYTGIEFPARRTTVLRIEAPRRALYWRASTLDTFVGDRWIEDLYPVAIGSGTRFLPANGLQPAAARKRESWIEQRVEVAALVDDHLVAAAEPMRLRSDDLERVVYQYGGVMRTARRVAKGQTYTVWSAAPAPTRDELLRSPARYPDEALRYLAVDRATVPAFGTAGRERAVDVLFTDVRYAALWPYRSVWERAQAVAGEAPTPYEATLAVERWLRSRGGFRYEERPPRSLATPPLVDFLERTKQGYCQQFAGSMALMLRLLGIPSRVAVGFTSGTWKDGVWTVTDHEAHAWVEVWLAGHGWLTFDPTPGRGRLSAAYTNASDSADAIRALGTGRFLDFSGQVPVDGGELRPEATRSGSSRPLWPYLAPLGLAAILLGGLGAGKAVRRRGAYRGDDPRRSASAARAELAGFLRDQGIEVGASAGVDALRREVARLGVRSDGFAAAFARARYGPPHQASAAAAETRRELVAVLRALRVRLGPGRRLRGFVALRSLRRA